MSTAPVGPYQLQAAIAAVHGQAGRAEATDWREIAGLYELLAAVAPGPMVTLNRVVAVAEVDGPEAGVREPAEAEQAYRRAASRTLSLPERRYLETRARDCSADV